MNENLGTVRFLLSPASQRGVRWRVNSSASPSPFLNLLTVLRALRGSVGGWGGLGLLDAALTLLLFRRLGGICADMERLAQRFQAGRLWRVADRAAVAPRVASDGRRSMPALRLPGRFGWLVMKAAYRAAGFGCQLRAVLEQPDMVELLLAAPRAVVILRPVCRMLAIETSLLRPRAAGAVVVEATEIVPVVKVRVRVKRAPVDGGRIPLPRGVLSAARREGFGKRPRG
jgi:hypothetical protein